MGLFQPLAVEFAVHKEEIAGTDNFLTLDADGKTVQLGPCLGTYGARYDAFTYAGLVAFGAGGERCVVDEGGFAVDVDGGGGLFGAAQIGEQGKRYGRGNAGDETEIGDDADDAVTAVATGNLTRGHGGFRSFNKLGR